MSEELTTRLDYELSVIKTMGYVDYFLIVWDFIKYAKDHGIMVGPGRGSAAGSLVSTVWDHLPSIRSGISCSLSAS